MITIEAEIDERGNVKILQPISFSAPHRALVVILDEPPHAERNDDALSQEELQAEDRVWEETFKRHADKFAALKAKAKSKVAQGQATDAFDENDNFVLS